MKNIKDGGLSPIPCSIKKKSNPLRLSDPLQFAFKAKLSCEHLGKKYYSDDIIFSQGYDEFAEVRWWVGGPTMKKVEFEFFENKGIACRFSDENGKETIKVIFQLPALSYSEDNIYNVSILVHD